MILTATDWGWELSEAEEEVEGPGRIGADEVDRWRPVRFFPRTILPSAIRFARTQNTTDRGGSRCITLHPLLHSPPHFPSVQLLITSGRRANQSRPSRRSARTRRKWQDAPERQNVCQTATATTRPINKITHSPPPPPLQK